jgi:3-keto-5-aminohexanoate cleavage enzyme
MQKDRGATVVPKTPDQIADAAERCWQAGAAVLHFHARDAYGANSGDRAIYAETIAKVRARCPILIQTTNGIGVRRDPETGALSWPSDKERLGILGIEPRQDLFGIALGSMDFYNPEGGYPGETPYVNSLDLLTRTITAVYERGSALEYEVVEASALHRLLRIAEEGVLDRHRKNIWLLHGGGFGATPPEARNVIFSIDEGLRLFPQAVVGVAGTGRDMFKLGTLGLAMGADLVRVGFEDGLYRASGELAGSNEEMVDDIVRIAAIYGRRPASVEEARETFELGMTA